MKSPSDTLGSTRLTTSSPDHGAVLGQDAECPGGFLYRQVLEDEHEIEVRVFQEAVAGVVATGSESFAGPSLFRFSLAPSGRVATISVKTLIAFKELSQPPSSN